ncbi:pyridoxamine 5'-phosphate oxidase family protein [Amycolatopsis alkalitolerans]|uniref:Pyridoxamine 5'-phosphate oxidase family protein n=1 Tax=Amycolatopsis alkalitolerans TaxID=2547244 RepID=A0A5C4LQ00_9PSEU|nr:pyridoxamine 5'-phosphate oxidase family protein [Amycolatopsis alkalitolerans]TNC19601.1 pyridoxamine 5'-phosphate oxidase family protein [Amycolatopsis alkalitolerans]
MTPERFQELSREESLRLLASVAVGRIVFTHQALPAIRPVHHLVDDGQVIVRGDPGTILLSAVDTVVAYEADSVAADDSIGWSVIVTGMARRLDAASPPGRYRALEGDGYFIQIRPELVTGFHAGPRA